MLCDSFVWLTVSLCIPNGAMSIDLILQKAARANDLVYGWFFWPFLASLVYLVLLNVIFLFFGLTKVPFGDDFLFFLDFLSKS